MRSKLTDLYKRASAAVVVLATGAVLSAAAAYLVAGQVEREARLKFESAVSDAKIAIESRVNAYADVLLGVRGLFIADNSASRVEFKRYIDSLDMNRRYPGIQVIHYSRPVTAAERPAFEAMVRGDTSVDPRGYPDFAIRSAGNRPEYVVAQYVEPMAGNERALGLDLVGDAARLAALDRTRESGQITASGTIALAHIPERHPGFAMRLAVYRKDAPLATVAQRREAFTGVVSVSFVAIDVMRGVLSQPFLQKIHVRIHDAGFLGSPDGLQPPTAENLMFDSDRLLGKEPAARGLWSGEPASLGSVSDLEVGGRRWNLYFSARQELGAPFDRLLPWLVLLFGVSISLLLFGLIRTLATTGTRAVELANRITGDLRRSEETLRATSEQLQMLIRSSPLAIYTRDVNGLLTSWNPAAEKMYGWKASEVLGKPLPTVPDGERAESDGFRMRLLAGLPFLKNESRRLRRDGTQIVIDAFLGPLRDVSGNVNGIVTVATDITERKRAEEALRTSEETLRAANEQLQMLIQSSPLAIYTRDVKGLLTSWNPAAEKMYGWKASEVLGKPLPTVPDGARAESDGFRMRLLAGEPFLKYEGQRRRRDGTPIDIDASQAPLRDVSGNVNGIIAVVTDITERKQAERALRDSEAKYRSVVAAIAEGVLLRDKDRRIVTCNASAERILGRTLDQMRGSLYFDASWQAIREDGSRFPDEERPATAALRTGNLQSDVVIGFRKPDRTLLWLSMSAQPLFDDPNAPPSGCVTTIADITERKQVQQRQTLEHKVTRLLSESETAEEAMPKIIQTICETIGFACGARTLRDERGQVIACAETWSVPSAEVMEFVAAGRQPLDPQRTAGGLIRRVWASGEPVWITDMVQDASFRRAPLAAKAGLHGAFAFPIRFGNEILGVMEFFSRDSRSPDEVLVQSMRSIGSQIGQFMARRQAEERVRHLAHFDDLTGLPNRSMFNQRLSHALARARRADEPLAILFIDLDRFKNINDTLGHEAGDRVLKEIAQRLRGCLREVDTVSRLGGDEFVVLIEGPPRPEDAAEVAQKILAAVAQPILLETQDFNLTASIGISAYPGDSEDVQGLMKNADIAMYRAKEQGRNNYQFYSAQVNVHTLERLAMESDLRHALERDEFVLHYQPKVDIGSNRITGMEALVRWRRSGEALIPPAQFIPLAEETGLIVPIGEWVLKTACLQSKAWQNQGLPRLRVAVNLSARQFAHESLLQDVARVLNETGLDPVLLELEITESMVMRDPEHAVALLRGLKAMGIHISIDDFGTGYSSLNYLKRFPLDNVKIDRSFIQDLPGDGDDAAITQAIIAMAHSLRLGVIAEGVETEEQLHFLRLHGCNEMQGYHFSRPLPGDEFLRLLQGSVVSASKLVKQG